MNQSFSHRLFWILGFAIAWHTPIMVMAVDFLDVEPIEENLRYFVSVDGDDKNSGLSIRSPFRTLQHAADLTVPGDTVYVLKGEYTAPGQGSTVLFIKNSGTPDKWIRYLAYPGHRPRIVVKNHWGGITVSGASYILVDGFVVNGDVRNVSLDYAMEQMSNLDNPITSGNGISVTNSEIDPSGFPHHIIIRNNRVRYCPGGGITTRNADYVRIEDNIVHHNGWTSPYAESGISMYHNSNFDDLPDVKMIVRRNLCFMNENKVPHYYSNPDDPDSRTISDGNGIIIDDTLNIQNDLPKEPYRGYTLVTENRMTVNGGRGLLIYLSENVIASNNTSLVNARSPTMISEIEVNESSNIQLFENVIRSRSDRSRVSTYQTMNSLIQSR